MTNRRASSGYTEYVPFRPERVPVVVPVLRYSGGERVRDVGMHLDPAMSRRSHSGDLPAADVGTKSMVISVELSCELRRSDRNPLPPLQSLDSRCVLELDASNKAPIDPRNASRLLLPQSRKLAFVLALGLEVFKVEKASRLRADGLVSGRIGISWKGLHRFSVRVRHEQERLHGFDYCPPFIVKRVEVVEDAIHASKKVCGRLSVGTT